MQTKLDRLKVAAQVGDWPLALRIAVRFSSLGPHAPAITRAHECLAGNDRFYRQIGKDPEALVAAGIEAVRQWFKLVAT